MERGVVRLGGWADRRVGGWIVYKHATRHQGILASLRMTALRIAFSFSANPPIRLSALSLDCTEPTDLRYLTGKSNSLLRNDHIQSLIKRLMGHNIDFLDTISQPDALDVLWQCVEKSVVKSFAVADTITEAIEGGDGQDHGI